MRLKKMPKHWPTLLAGAVIGALIILGIRFFTYNVPNIHYHANFAVYINSQKEEFKADSYYEEETACKAEKNMMPVDRAHMHEHINNVVHVHDQAVTWGQFFENLGWALGKDFIGTREAMYTNNGNNQLHIILDGQDLTGISSITNTVIKDQSTLLLNYGDLPNDELQTEYKAIPNNAKQHDEEQDPATCSGSAAAPSFSERLKHVL